MFKPFYVHENTGPGKLTGRAPRGFTLKVAQDPDNPRNLLVSGAWCSHKDEFVKRVGRETADKAEAVVINKRYLPKFVAGMTSVVYTEEVHPQVYDYLLKFVV